MNLSEVLAESPVALRRHEAQFGLTGPPLVQAIIDRTEQLELSPFEAYFMFVQDGARVHTKKLSAKFASVPAILFPKLLGEHDAWKELANELQILEGSPELRSKHHLYSNPCSLCLFLKGWRYPSVANPTLLDPKVLYITFPYVTRMMAMLNPDFNLYCLKMQVTGIFEDDSAFRDLMTSCDYIGSPAELAVFSLLCTEEIYEAYSRALGVCFPLAPVIPVNPGKDWSTLMVRSGHSALAVRVLEDTSEEASSGLAKSLCLIYRQAEHTMGLLKRLFLLFDRAALLEALISEIVRHPTVVAVDLFEDLFPEIRNLPGTEKILRSLWGYVSHISADTDEELGARLFSLVETLDWCNFPHIAQAPTFVDCVWDISKHPGPDRPLISKSDVIENFHAVHFLVEVLGASVLTSDAQGRTPAHFCARSRTGTAETFEYLIAAGSEMAAIDAKGATVLHYAAANSTKGIIDLAVRAGVQINVRDRSGMSPFDVAVEQKSLPAIRALANAAHELEQQLF